MLKKTAVSLRPSKAKEEKTIPQKRFQLARSKNAYLIVTRPIGVRLNESEQVLLNNFCEVNQCSRNLVLREAVIRFLSSI